MIAGGWSNPEPEGTGQQVQVVRLPRGPVEGSEVLSTLGLSHHVMHSPHSGKMFRIELVMLYRASEGPRNLPGVIQQVVAEALRDHHCLSRGDVVGPWGPLREGSSAEALYLSAPAYFPESFAVYTPDDGSVPVAMAWLVPITAAEAVFVRQAGWEQFETELERQNPDLLDLGRPAIHLRATGGA
jgi:hypothetical protein